MKKRDLKKVIKMVEDGISLQTGISLILEYSNGESSNVKAMAIEELAFKWARSWWGHPNIVELEEKVKILTGC